MRIARWVGPNGLAEGFVVANESSDWVVPFPEGATVQLVLDRGLSEAHRLYELLHLGAGQPIADVQLLAPLIPTTIRDFVTFEEHVEGMSGVVDGKGAIAAEWYEAPTFYFTNPHTVCATGDVVSPPETERLDFELELAAVVGGVAESNGANLEIDQAAQHIFGYLIMNDWSARDLQAREMQVRLGPCKGKDFGMTLGPWIVTADEVTPFENEDGFLAIRAEAYVNGELIGHDLVSNMGWTFAELVAYAARNSVVRPGDVVGSGTVGNGGCLGELWGYGRDLPPLKTGDEVKLVIEGIGEIVNTIGDRVKAPHIPVARARSKPRARTRS